MESEPHTNDYTEDDSTAAVIHTNGLAEDDSTEVVIQFNYNFAWFVLPTLIGCAGGALLILVIAVFFWLPLVLAAAIPISYAAYIYLLWQSTVYTILPDRIIHRHGIFLAEDDDIYFEDIRKRKKKIEIPGTEIGSILLETAAQSGNNAKGLEGDVVIKNIDNVTVIYNLIVQLERMARAKSRSGSY